MDQAVAPDQELTDRLVAALRQDEFVLYGQAIVALGPGRSPRPFQEILIRFQEEEAKLLPPGSFFPVLEECGLMPYVDRWVVSRICRWARSALAIKADWLVPQNSINLSAATLSERNFAEYTRKHLRAADLPEGTVSFEVTCDSAALQVKSLLGMMAQLRPSGCSFVLARFDGGVETFELLRRLAPEYVKLSPGVVRMLDQGTAGVARIEDIVGACHALGVRTIAEHVESDRTLAQLRGLGVHFGQGFGIQAPRALG